MCEALDDHEGVSALGDDSLPTSAMQMTLS